MKYIYFSPLIEKTKILTNRAGENTKEIRQENRRRFAATNDPKSPAAAIFHDWFNLQACEGVRNHHRSGVSAVGGHRQKIPGSEAATAWRGYFQQHGGCASHHAGDKKRKFYYQSFFSTATHFTWYWCHFLLATSFSHTHSVMELIRNCIMYWIN